MTIQANGINWTLAARKGFPVVTTVAELTEIARQKMGNRFHSVKVCVYGGGRQVEVRGIKNGYHGREMTREVCYDILGE